MFYCRSLRGNITRMASCVVTKIGYGLLVLLMLCDAGLKSFTAAMGSRDAGTCNTTSDGNAFSGGYYGSRILKPLPFPSTSRDLTSAHAQMTCWYSFRGAPGQRVMFEVRQLNVGKFHNRYHRCEHGYLRLWDGLSRPGSYNYPPNTMCGHYPDGHMQLHKFSSGPDAQAEYVASTQHHHHHHQGFTLTYKYVNVDIETDMFPLLSLTDMKRASSAVCDWVVQTEKCHNNFCDIISPGHPGIYPPNLECGYHVFSSDVTSSLQVSFKDYFTGQGRFNITASPACEREYLAVYDGDSPESALIGRFCGQEVPDITTSGRHIFLQFTTGPSLPPFSLNGFHATVMSVTKEWNLSGHMVRGTLCDWLFNRSEGSVSAPDHWLPADTTCTYTLQSRQGFYMETLLAIYGLTPGCVDSITVREEGEEVDKICQSKLSGHQSRFQYHLVGKNITITYQTTWGQYQSSPDRGFWLSFRKIKGPRKYPIIIHLKDEAARYTVDESSFTSGFDRLSFEVTSVLVTIVSLWSLLSQITLVR